VVLVETVAVSAVAGVRAVTAAVRRASVHRTEKTVKRSPRRSR
jgi:hypothetical protein